MSLSVSFASLARVRSSLALVIVDRSSPPTDVLHSGALGHKSYAQAALTQRWFVAQRGAFEQSQRWAHVSRRQLFAENRRPVNSGWAGADADDCISTMPGWRLAGMPLLEKRSTRQPVTGFTLGADVRQKGSGS